MSRWRKWQQAARTGVFCDQLAESGLWPFRRYAWKPDLRSAGFLNLTLQGPSGPITILPHPGVSDGTALLLSEPTYIGRAYPIDGHVSFRQLLEFEHDEASQGRIVQLIHLSPGQMAVANREAADSRSLFGIDASLMEHWRNATILPGPPLTLDSIIEALSRPR